MSFAYRGWTITHGAGGYRVKDFNGFSFVNRFDKASEAMSFVDAEIGKTICKHDHLAEDCALCAMEED